MTSKHITKNELLLLCFLIICFTLIFSFCSIERHEAFCSRAWDLGIFNQTFWNIVHTGTQINTLETAQVTFKLNYLNNLAYNTAIPTPQPAIPVNHLGVHFSLILYLFAPIYAIFQNPKTLLILQSFMVGLGVLPLYLIAKEKTQSIYFALILGICYLLYPAVYNITLFDFHELAFAPALILFALYFLETRRYKYFWMFLALSFFVKEDIALSGIFIGLYITLTKKEKKLGALVSIVSLIYFIATIKIFMPFFGQPYNFTNRYLELTSSVHKGYFDIIYHVATNPWNIFQFTFLDPRKIIYIADLFYPVIFLPFFSGFSFILILPGLFVNLLSSYGSQYSVYYHYNGIIIPFIFFTAIIGYANLQKRLPKSKYIILCLLAITIVITSWSAFTRLSLYKNSLISTISDKNQTLANILNEIPPSASVASTVNIVPHLTERKEIWLFPAINNAEYVLFEISEQADYWPAGYINTFKLLTNLLENKEYGILAATENYILLKKGYDISKNTNTLIRMKERFELIKERRGITLFAPG